MIEPAGLGERGSGIFQAMAEGVTDPARVALITELARTADRLDELDNIIQGKGVLHLLQFRVLDNEIHDDGQNISVEVKFNAVLAEARQQALAFSTVLKSLGMESKAAAAPAKPEPVAQPLTGADMLAAMREKRAAGAS